MAGHTPRRIASVLTRGFLGGGQNGFSALHLAARHGHLAVVKYLVEKAGADVLLKSERGQTPPGVAAAAISDYMQLVSRAWFAISACMLGAVLMGEWMWQAASLAPVKKLARQAAASGRLEDLQRSVAALSEYRIALGDVSDEVRVVSARVRTHWMTVCGRP